LIDGPPVWHLAAWCYPIGETSPSSILREPEIERYRRAEGSFSGQFHVGTGVIAMIAFHCPKCRTLVQRHEQEVGTKILCPSCGQRLQVPQPRPSDQTLMGELAIDPANKTALGELAPQPAAKEPRAASPIPARTPGITFRFACPYCQAGIGASVNHAGKRGTCPRCKSPMDIPMPGRAIMDEPLVVKDVKVDPPIEVCPTPVVPSSPLKNGLKGMIC
jgi:Zn finger protein HypA/HybF involved in hydrogenase expression